MLFMGEEWGGATTPFQFFTSHPEPELGEATAKGRKAEFAAHGWNSDDIPDPQDPQTFLRSKLDWDERDDETRARVLACYRDLLALRRKRIEITDPWLGGTCTSTTTRTTSGSPCAAAHYRSCAIWERTRPRSRPAEPPILWWDPPTQDETASATAVPGGHSFVVLES